jgi:hypothetical protein
MPFNRRMNVNQKANSSKTSTSQKQPQRRLGKAVASPTKKKKLARPKTSKEYFALAETQQETWNRAVHAVAKMRAEGKSLIAASREFGVDPRKVRALAGTALRKTKSGRYVARRNDRLLRVLVIPGPQGLTEIAVRGSDIASKIAEYSDAVQKYLRTGDSSSLRKFKRLKLLDEKGKRIKLVTDLAKLQELGSAGVLSFESLYRRAA